MGNNRQTTSTCNQGPFFVVVEFSNSNAYVVAFERVVLSKITFNLLKECFNTTITIFTFILSGF